MYSIEPVKDQAYTIDDLLMKKGYHRMPDGSMMRDEDHIMKKGKRGQKQKQKQKQSVVIRNVINIGKKERKRRPKPKPKTEKREIKPLPSYSISTGASGASFTPFYPPAPLYRNMVIASPPTTNDDITTSQKRTAQLISGTSLNQIEQKSDKEDVRQKIEDVIINKNEEIEEPQPPSFEELFGGIEYKTEDEKDKIERIKLDYEMGLNARNQKRREASARKKISQLEQMKGRIDEMERIQTDLLLNSSDLINRMNEEQKQKISNVMNKQQESEPKKEKKQRRTKLEMEEVRFVVKDTAEAEKKFNENMEKIRQSRQQQDNSTPSDENMSSRVQSLKRGHITPMLARYI